MLFRTWILSVPAPFVEETILSTLRIPGSLVYDQLTLSVRVYFGALYSVLLISIAVSMPVAYWFFTDLIFLEQF